MTGRGLSHTRLPSRNQTSDDNLNSLESIVVHNPEVSASITNENDPKDLSQPSIDTSGRAELFQTFTQVRADTAFLTEDSAIVSHPTLTSDVHVIQSPRDMTNVTETPQIRTTMRDIADDMFEHTEEDEHIESIYPNRKEHFAEHPDPSIMIDSANEHASFLSIQKSTPINTQRSLPWSQTWNVNVDAVSRLLKHEDVNSIYQLPLSSQASGNSIAPEQSSYNNTEHKTIRYDPDYKFSLYSNEYKLIQSHTFEGLSEISGSKKFLEILETEQFWLDISCPKGTDMNILSKIFNIHPLTIEDIQDLDPREKCELFEAYIFICIGTCDYDTVSSTNLDYIYMFVIVFSNCIISIHHKPIPHIRRVLKRIIRSRLKISSDWVMYALLDDTVDLFMPIIKKIEFEVDSIDDLVLFLSENDQKDMLRRIGHSRKMVSSMLKLLNPKTEIIKMLVKRHANRLKNNTIVYLRDIQDHVLTMGQSLDHFGESLNRSHSNYLAQISIELTQASNRMNHVMKTLTVWAAFSMPLTLYAGIMGMNVPVPGQILRDGENLIPFFIILASMVLIIAGIFFIYKKFNKHG